MTTEARLAVVETEIRIVKSDVAEIKADVKTLLVANAAGVGVVAFIRTIAPWASIAIALSALLAASGG